MGKAIYKPQLWENRPIDLFIQPLVKSVEYVEENKLKVTVGDGSSRFIALPDIDSMVTTTYNSTPDPEIKLIKPISYTCKNCNGHINPATMKCEYCDTQY